MNIITEGKLKAGAAFIKLARQYGAKLVRSKKHNVFRDAAGHQITAPKTTSDFRAIKNFESELKGRGFIKQDTVSKVKDALVKGSKETVLKPATKTPVNRQTTFKDFTQKYQPNVQGPRKPNTTKADVSRRELENRMERGYKQSIKDMSADEKFELANKVLRDLRKSKVTEQMVVPRGLKKKNPLMTPETEMELLKRLSNRKSFYDRARTGRPIYPFSEDNKHRDAKLNYQYKQVTDPKRPVDPIKQLKKGMV